MAEYRYITSEDLLNQMRDHVKTPRIEDELVHCGQRMAPIFGDYGQVLVQVCQVCRGRAILRSEMPLSVSCEIVSVDETECIVNLYVAWAG